MRKLWVHLLHKIGSWRFFQFYFSRINTSNTGMVITLHRITQSSANTDERLNSFIEISEDKLEEVIVNLKKLHVKFVTLGELENIPAVDNSSEPIVHVSFDDGYLDNYTIAFPLLKKHNVRFSIFLVSDFINNPHPFLWWYIIENIIKTKIPVSFEKYGFEITQNMYATVSEEIIFEKFRTLLLENVDTDPEYFKSKLYNYINHEDGFMPQMLTWDQVNEMLNSGLCEIGVHTKTHARFTKISDTEKVNQITACKAEIKEHTGIDAKYFAYPYGNTVDIGASAPLDTIMQTCGIRLAFTTIPFELNTGSNKYLLPRVFFNNSTTMYTLKTRLTGSYQRNTSLKSV